MDLHSTPALAEILHSLSSAGRVDPRPTVNGTSVLAEPPLAIDLPIEVFRVLLTGRVSVPSSPLAVIALLDACHYSTPALSSSCLALSVSSPPARPGADLVSRPRL